MERMYSGFAVKFQVQVRCCEVNARANVMSMYDARAEIQLDEIMPIIYVLQNFTPLISSLSCIFNDSRIILT